MLSVSIDIPELAAVVVNRDDLVAQMTNNLAAAVASRTRRGDAVSGSLPTSMRKTGQLLASIGGKVTKKGDQSIGYVTALGKRDKSEAASIRTKAKRARERTQQLRAAASLGMALSSVGRSAGSPAPPKIRLSRLRVRTVTDNASLAAILSTEPRDPRGVAGKRGVYRVFGVRDAERQELVRIARTADVAFVSTGTRTVGV